MSDMRLIVAGAGGRMGRTLVKAIAETPGVTLAGAFEEARSPLIGQDSGTLAGLGANGIPIAPDVKARANKADGLIDFTVPKATVTLAALAAQAGLVHIIGTTGLSAADEAKIREAARAAVIVQSGNMSVGINLLAALVRRVAKTLDEEFDIEILEMHHNKKVDAPSGTRCCSAARQRKGAVLISTSAPCARATARPARASRATSALPPCAAAAWSVSIA